MSDSDITIVGLQALGGVGQIVLSWAVDDPNTDALPYLRFKKAEVQYSLSADMSSPVSLGYASTAMVNVPVPRGETRYYQVRAINFSDQTGEWCAAVSDHEISGDVLIASPGYWKLPSGLIIQWGLSSPSDVSGNAAITFATAFPNDCFTCVAVTNNNNPLYVVSAGLTIISLSGASFLLTAIFENLGTLHREVIVGSRVWWIAVGY